MLLSAVDSGVPYHRLCNAGSVERLLWPETLRADIYDIYGQVIEGQGRLASLRFGGDGDELKRGGKPPVNHVTIIAQQAQPVVLDEKGEGTVTLPIGDFNELRVMAQAWTTRIFTAAAEGKKIEAAPVIAELNVCRAFLAEYHHHSHARISQNLTDKRRPSTLRWPPAVCCEGEKYRRCIWLPARAPCCAGSRTARLAMVR